MYHNTDLHKKFFFTIFILIVYRFGSFVPVPGINSFLLSELSAQNNEGILGIFNMLSGGSLSRMSVFALAIMPYITASILVQLMTVIYEPMADLKKEGESGRRKMIQISRYATIFFAIIQAYGIAVGLEVSNKSYNNLILISPLLFRIITVLTLLVGTMLLMWLGERISVKGIGSGSALIIFTGIVSGLPNGISSIFQFFRKGVLSGGSVFIILCSVCFLLTLIIFAEMGQRRILVHYPSKQNARRQYANHSSHIPIKINTAGVIPPIFASSLLLLPTTIVGFIGDNSLIFMQISRYLSHGKPLFLFMYVLLIILFCFVYSGIIFPTDETANNLKKTGAYIAGKRPGQHTSEYIKFVLTRINVLGSIYLAFVCVVPELFMNKYSVTFSLGGTSLLIVVNVVLDTTAQVQSYMYGNKYSKLLKNSKLL